MGKESKSIHLPGLNGLRAIAALSVLWGHTFRSIGVEEQFYLFWPWLVKLTRGRTGRLLALAVAVCLGWLACKWGLYMWQGTGTAYRFFAATRFDCMMLGAIGAILYFTKAKWFNQLMSNRWLGLICLLLLLFSAPWVGIIPAPVRPQVIALLSLVCILNQLYRPVINLENRLCDFVGKISYGIYIIHPLLIFLLSGLYRSCGLYLSNGLATVFIYVLITLSTIFIAWLSYRFYESPFLRLKNRFAIVHSQNSMK